MAGKAENPEVETPEGGNLSTLQPFNPSTLQPSGPSTLAERELLASAPARVAELDARARRSAAEAVECALACGRLLLAVKGRMPHGAFLLWLARECPSVKERTAQRYMSVAAQYGAGAAGGAAQLEERTLTRLYRDYGIVRAPEGWGGRREGAGRKPSGLAEELDAAAALEPALWAAARGALDALLSLDAERALFSRLSTPHLSDAAGLLADLWGRARTSLARRQEGGGE